MNISLSLGINSYDHVRDLVSGEVRPAGIDLVPLELPIEELFYRFSRFREWHVSEMSFGKVVSMMSEEKPEIIALPVFLSRVFRHSAIYLPEGSPIKAPKDLEGRRVGIPEWAQTAGIYVRGMLAHEYGVDLARIEWFQAGVREPGRVEKVALHLPAGVKIRRMADKTLLGMLAAGELDAVMSAREIPAPRLFKDYRAVEAEYWKQTRIFPIMHVLVLKRDVYERDRWIAMNLFKAFDEARRRSVARVREFGLSHVPLPRVPDHTKQWVALAGEDFWPYGIEPSRPTLEAFFQYAHEQGVAKKRLRMEDVFAPETREQFRI
ncbi:MAG TPA: 4,5-dihydroxyphthalate decarboxylase [Burkholderiales bacterium]|nr:4,5-dihydroxyphthalate decarboxylase [Burkholderiales bacterium]